MMSQDLRVLVLGLPALTLIAALGGCGAAQGMAAQIMARSAVPKKCFKHWSISHLSGPKIYHESGNDALHEFLSRATCVDATL